VCVHNAGRSVMAEAFYNGLADGRGQADSAGTIPGALPHPVVVEAMREVGIDVSGHQGVLITDEMVSAADRVITMGCAVEEAACPAIRYSNVEDWGLPDPKGQPLERVREIREEIRRRVQALLEDMGAR
jgi:arsenate reductase